MTFISHTCETKNRIVDNLRSRIAMSVSFEECLSAFRDVSIEVYNGVICFDMLNSCEGQSSPLSVFFDQLMKPRFESFFRLMLDSIQTEDDYHKCQWMIEECNAALFSHLEIRCALLFIRHPIVGRHFNFFSACVDDGFCRHNGLSLAKVDCLFVFLYNLYEQYHGHNPCSRFVHQYSTVTSSNGELKVIENFKIPFNIKSYKEEVMKDLRGLGSDENTLHNTFVVLKN